MDKYIKVSDVANLIGISKVSIYKKLKDPEFKYKYVKKIHGINSINSFGIDILKKQFNISKPKDNKDADEKFDSSKNSISNLDWLKEENEKLHKSNEQLAKLLDQQQQLTLIISNQNKDLISQLKDVKDKLKLTDGEFNGEQFSKSVKEQNNSDDEHKKHWWAFWK